MACPISRSVTISSAAEFKGSTNQALNRLLLANRADPAGNALAAAFLAEKVAIRRRICLRLTVSSNSMMTPEPSVAPMTRVPSSVSGVSVAARGNESAGRAA